MMNEIFFLCCFGFILAHFLGWGFKHLPNERWQMLAVIPRMKNEKGSWVGRNFTYYGFFIATSQMISILLLLILLGSIHASFAGTSLVVGIVLIFCLPAARIMAIIVEKKRHTFTIGGASFVGIILAPWAVVASNSLLSYVNIHLPVMPLLAAMSIAYTLGEGLGRLGCISYGCCYGKPIKDCSPLFQKLFAKTGVIFHGETKKVIYEGKLSGERLVPIQAITCIIYTLGALLGSYFFFSGWYTAALIFTIALTQLWRVVSEMFRADFRGFGKISAYQKMGIIGVVYMVGAALLIPTVDTLSPDVLFGLQALWSPVVILGVQALWLVFFFSFGKSTVTSSNVSFELIHDHI